MALGDQRKLVEKTLPPPVSWNAVQKELSFHAPKYVEGSLSLYIITPAVDSALIKSLGYEREVAFRLFGGGTGQPWDIDAWDSLGYEQIICVDSETERIVGGYRFARGPKLVGYPAGERGAVEHLFTLSPDFVEHKLPYSLELGRSFIDASSEKSGRIMDILWYGLGYLISKDEWKFFMGKATFYPKELKSQVLDILHTFLILNFPPKGDTLTGAREEFRYIPESLDPALIESIDPKAGGGRSFEECRKNLFRICTRKGQSLRPFMLLFKYLSVGDSSVEFYGSAINPDFGDVVEIFFTLPITAENHGKMERYIKPIMGAG